MKKVFLVLGLVAYSAAYAQQSTLTQSSNTETTVIQLPESQPAAPQAPQVVIVPAAQTSQRVIEQPKTTVEAAPLVKSRAEQLRDARKDVEIQTEQKIVEKLEESRMQDERDRAERLFGDRFNGQQAEKQVEPQVQVVPVQQQVVPVTTIEVEEDNTDEKLDAMKSEIIQTVRGDLKAAQKKAEPEDKNEVYVGGLAGAGEYPGLVNVDGNNSFGVVVGTTTGDFTIEGSYIRSDFFVSENIFIFKDLEQDNFMFTAKYNVLKDRIRPQVGAAASYTRRTYVDVTQGAGGFFPGFASDTEFESTAFDIGLVLGVDIALGSNFLVGIDYRYMTNVSYTDDFNTPYRNYVANQGGTQLIEESDYQIFSLSGKVTF